MFQFRLYIMGNIVMGFYFARFYRQQIIRKLALINLAQLERGVLIGLHLLIQITKLRAIIKIIILLLLEIFLRV